MSRERPAPPRRGRRLPWRRAEYAALDFETTGLDFNRDEVVSFGVVPVSGGRAVLGGAVHQLIHPSMPPSPRSQTVHELRPADLADSPNLDEARGLLRVALDRRFLLVWYADVEIHFLNRTFGGGRRSWERRCIDVRNLAIAVEGKPVEVRRELGFALGQVAERYGVPVANPHEALDDAFVTAQLFLALAGKLPGHPDPTVRDLLGAARPT